MNAHNQNLKDQLQTYMFSSLDRIKINGEPINLDTILISLTTDPMLDDPTVQTLELIELKARYKVIDSCVVLYSEQTYVIPGATVISIKDHDSIKKGTSLKVLSESGGGSKWTLETTKPPYKSINLKKEDVILDLNVKNLYFCIPKIDETARRYEGVLARYEYSDELTSEKIDDAWKMFNAVYPHMEKHIEKGTAIVTLMHYHPTAMNKNAYDLAMKKSLNDLITIPINRARYNTSLQSRIETSIKP